MNILYPAKISLNRTNNRYTVEFIDFDEAITEGEILEEALFNAAEVLTLTLEGRMGEKMDIPHPTTRLKKDIYWITPSAKVQAALLLRSAKGNVTTAQIARALETSWPAIQRLEDPHHWPSLRQLERAAAAIGKRLVLSFESVKD